MEDLEVFIEWISDIKKSISEFEDSARDSDCFTEDEFEHIFRETDNSYCSLTTVKDYLMELDYQRRMKADDKF